MKRAVLLLAVLLAVPAAAGPEQVEGVFLDHFHAPTVDDFALTTGCQGGDWTDAPAGAPWFEYIESDLATAPGAPVGYFDTGCGRATLVVPVPAGNEHLHIRFHAERTVESLAASFPENIIQELNLFGDGRQLVSIPYLAGLGGNVNRQPFDMGSIQIPPGINNLTLEWYFEDAGQSANQQAPSVLSGVAFRSRISDINLEFSEAPVAHTIESTNDRQGTLRQETLTVRATVPNASSLPALRVRTDAALELSHVVFPDGSRTSDFGTIDEGVITGFDLQRVLLEQTSGYTQVTVTAALVQEHGPGEYQVVLTDTNTVQYSPLLIPFAILLFALPLPFAALAYAKTRSFEREAFGAYRRSARNLRFGVLVVFAYYVVVVFSAFLSGRLDLTTVWPLPFEGWLQYIQVAVAIGAFLVLWRVARQLEAIVRPPAETD